MIFRGRKAQEKLDKMTAHEGECHHCHGPVKMFRGDDGALLPNRCMCLQCGQHYFMEIEDIHAWEVEQWEQKWKRWAV